MENNQEFYIVAKVDSTDDYGTDANVCIVHVLPDRLEKWNDLHEKLLALHTENPDVNELSLQTLAGEFVDNDDLLELIDDSGYALFENIPLEWAEDSALRGWRVNICYDGDLMFECYNKYSDVSYYTGNIPLDKLVQPEFETVDWDAVATETENGTVNL